MRKGKATEGLVQHCIAKKAGLKEFFERFGKIVAKNFPFSKEICKFEKGKNFCFGKCFF